MRNSYLSLMYYWRYYPFCYREMYLKQWLDAEGKVNIAFQNGIVIFKPLFSSEVYQGIENALSLNIHSFNHSAVGVGDIYQPYQTNEDGTVKRLEKLETLTGQGFSVGNCFEHRKSGYKAENWTVLKEISQKLEY